MSSPSTTIRIGDWGEVKGGRQRSPRLTEGRKRPYLRVANVFDGFIDTSDVLEMLFTDSEFRRYVLQPGDILLNEGQSSELVGRSAIYAGPPDTYAYQNTLVRFRAGPNCNPQFAQALFRTLWKLGAFERISKKTTSIAHLGVTRFANLRVSVPPLEVQDRVSLILRAFDSVTAGVQKVIALKEARRRALMRTLLSGERRFPGFDNPWRTSQLGDIARFQSGHTPSRADDSYWGGDIPWVTAKDMKSFFLNTSKDRLTEAGAATARLVQPGDVLVLVRGNLSREVPIGVAGVPLAYNQDVKALIPSPDASGEFLGRYLQGILGLLQRELTITGHGVGRLDSDQLRSVEIRIPSRDEQDCITSFLSLVDRDVELTTKQFEAIEVQKSALMHRLLSGDIPDLDPAA